MLNSNSNRQVVAVLQYRFLSLSDRSLALYGSVPSYFRHMLLWLFLVAGICCLSFHTLTSGRLSVMCLLANFEVGGSPRYLSCLRHDASFCAEPYFCFICIFFLALLALLKRLDANLISWLVVILYNYPALQFHISTGSMRMPQASPLSETGSWRPTSGAWGRGSAWRVQSGNV